VIDFLTFQMVITPSVVVVVYLLGLLAIPVSVYLLFKKIDHKLSLLASISLQIILVLFLELFWRMLNEFIIVYFKIYQALA